MRSELVRGRGIALLVALGLLFVPAHAGGKGQGKDNKKMDGGINPTNTATVESDLMTMAMEPSSSGSGSLEDQMAAAMMDEAMKQPAAAQIQAAAAHKVATGKGVRVAVLDGGFNLAHPMIAPSLSSDMYDAIDGDDDPSDLGNGIDEDGDGIVDFAVGHGTFVAAMVLLAAPDAEIVPVRVRDDEGWGTNEELNRGLQFAMSRDVDVINLSVDAAQASNRGLWRYIYRAHKQGIVVVVSAGNDGGALNMLSDIYNIVAVGAVDGNDVIADFSNRADWKPFGLLTFAPGVDLCGPVGSGDEMGYWSGTSFSAGLVSGAAALVRELHPDYGVASVGKVLGSSVDPVWNADGTPYAFGGRIDLAKVVSR